MSDIREEIRRRIPRLTMSLVMAVIFWIISAVVPQTVRNINIPGLNVDAGFLMWTITMAIAAIFLIRALSDAIVIGDIVTDIIIKQMGIKEEKSPKRAARDFIYIIIIILIATAILPFMHMLGGNVGSWLTILVTYIAIGIITILIYDIGRILYRIIEQKAESLADRFSEMAEENNKNKG
ncbi:MAG: hypothetical protein PVH12_06060 [Candidatus Bathyarchaeota archaeon]